MRAATNLRTCRGDLLGEGPRRPRARLRFRAAATHLLLSLCLPIRSDSQDEVNERAFWSGLTNSPPLYGADTPVSLFDEKLPFGWNLRRLGCMLQDPRYDVPNIPGEPPAPGSGGPGLPVAAHTVQPRCVGQRPVSAAPGAHICWGV